MKLDTYSIIARLFPALISSAPLYVLYYYLINPTVRQFLGGLLSLQVASGVTLTLALVYALSQINRYLAKTLFENRIFKNGLYLPTTTYLTHGDSGLSREYKARVHAKIEADFGIRIPPADEEARNNAPSRKLISEAVEQIRTRVEAGYLTSQHNAEYGFVRNLAGGSVIALFLSILNLAIFGFFFPETKAMMISSLFCLLYLLFVLFSKRLIMAYGQNYAKVLIREFLAK